MKLFNKKQSGAAGAAVTNINDHRGGEAEGSTTTSVMALDFRKATAARYMEEKTKALHVMLQTWREKNEGGGDLQWFHWDEPTFRRAANNASKEAQLAQKYFSDTFEEWDAAVKALK